MSSESNRVAVLPGDGIGPEVTRQAVKVMQALAKQAGLDLVAEDYPMGGAGIDAAGVPLPPQTLKAAREAKAVLLGAVGGPKWAKVDFAKRPEAGLLQLRQELALFANLRPAQIYGDLVTASTLKQEVVEGVDLMVVRELTGGIYFGEPRGMEGTAPNRRGFNTLTYTEPEIERICRVGFEVAQKRRHALCSVDKANVLEVSVLWREIATDLQKDYPDVALEHMYVDNAAMQLIRNPRHFDTLVTTNMFGDILSDAAAMLTGSIGMLPSASIGQEYAMYEPVHGSAPDIAGQDKANPLAAILSVGMLFRYTFDRPDLDERVRSGVTALLAKYRTPDIQAPGLQPVGCEQMGDLMLEQLEAPAQPIAAR